MAVTLAIIGGCVVLWCGAVWLGYTIYAKGVDTGYRLAGNQGSVTEAPVKPAEAKYIPIDQGDSA